MSVSIKPYALLFDQIPGQTVSGPLAGVSFYPFFPVYPHLVVSDLASEPFFSDIYLIKVIVYYCDSIGVRLQDVEPVEIISGNGSITSNMRVNVPPIPLPPGGSCYNEYSLQFKVAFLDNRMDELDYMFLDDRIWGIRGKLGQAEVEVTRVNPKGIKSFISTSDEVTFIASEVVDEDHPPTLRRKNGIVGEMLWYIHVGPEVQISIGIGGTDEPVNNVSNELISISDAISRGMVRATTRTYATTVPDVGYGTIRYHSELKLQFLVHGSFQILAAGVNWTSINIEQYYWSGSAEFTAVAMCKPVKSTPCTGTGMSSFTVFDSLCPSIEMESVTPSSYLGEITEPLNGRPPFTVVYRDTSTLTTIPHSVPVNTPAPIYPRVFTWDFGDPGSGGNNIAVENVNTGSAWLPKRATDQTHVYHGYGPYICTLTVTDVNGNRESATVKFAPNDEQRVTQDPEITPSTGVQPLTVEGRAFVGGTPLPTVKWAYSLNGDTEGLYNGEKYGEYVELTLLMDGVYTVVCTVYDKGDAVMQTDTFTVTVAQAPVNDDTPVAMNDFCVWIYANGERVDILQPATNLRYIDRYAGGKAVMFELPMDYPYLQNLRVDNQFDVGYLGIARRMVVMSYEEGGDGNTVKIGGIDAASYVFRYRVATRATTSIFGDGRDVALGPGEDVMRYFAVSNIDTGDRVVPILKILDESERRGGFVSISARYDKISDVLDTLCTMTGLGWDTSLQLLGEESVGWKVIEGVDRTINQSENDPIIFSGRVDGLRNATIGAYSEYSSPNVAIGAGAGEGPIRTYTDFGDTDAEGINRREVFVDAGDKANEDEVRLTAIAKLKQLEDRSIMVYPSPECQWVFGVDYKVGDYVTVETMSGMIMDMQIVSAEVSLHQGEGELLMLKCGVDERGTRTVLRELELANTWAKK